MEQEDLLAFSDSDVVREAVRLAARSYDSLGASLEGSRFEKEPAAA
jgi:Arc/MetJ-type ribon-helix-helix transcriptional regulator